MAKRQAEPGPEHKHFRIIEARAKGDDKVECLYCEKHMVAGATRMRAHLLKHRGIGCSPCVGLGLWARADPQTLDLDALRRIGQDGFL